MNNNFKKKKLVIMMIKKFQEQSVGERDKTTKLGEKNQ